MKTPIKVLTLLQRVRRKLPDGKRIVKHNSSYHLQNSLDGSVEVHSIETLVNEYGVLDKFEEISYV